MTRGGRRLPPQRHGRAGGKYADVALMYAYPAYIKNGRRDGGTSQKALFWVISQFWVKIGSCFNAGPDGLNGCSDPETQFFLNYNEKSRYVNILFNYVFSGSWVKKLVNAGPADVNA